MTERERRRGEEEEEGTLLWEKRRAWGGRERGREEMRPVCFSVAESGKLTGGQLTESGANCITLGQGAD